MMTCNNCGKEIPEGAQTCVYCGAEVMDSQKIQPIALLKMAWQKVRENIKTLAILEAVFLLPALLWFVAFNTGGIAQWLEQESSGALITAILIIGVYGVLRLLVLISQVYAIGANVTDSKAALRYSLKRFFPVVGYIVLLSLLVLPLAILSVVPVLVGFGLYPGLAGVAAVAPYVFLLAIPVYAYFSTRLAFTVPLSVLNEAAGSKLKQSWQLTQSFVWQTFKGIFMIGALVLVLQVPFELLAEVLPPLVGGVVSMIVQSALQILSIVFIVVLLRDVQKKRSTHTA